MAGLVLVRSKAPLQRFAKAVRVGMICRGYCLENGLIMPPLVMTHGPVDDMVALILTCLDLSHRGVKQRGCLAEVLDADAYARERLSIPGRGILDGFSGESIE